MGSRHGRQPYIRVHLESAEDVVIVEGFGDDVTTDPVLGGRVVAEWLRKYAKAGARTGQRRRLPDASAHGTGMESRHPR
jgi:hypothetical protein